MQWVHPLVQSVQQSVQSVQSAHQPAQPVQVFKPVQLAPTSAAFQVEVLVSVLEQVLGHPVLEDSAATTRLECFQATKVSDSEATVVHS